MDGELLEYLASTNSLTDGQTKLWKWHGQCAEFVSDHKDAELSTKENMLFSATDIVYGKVLLA